MYVRLSVFHVGTYLFLLYNMPLTGPELEALGHGLLYRPLMYFNIVLGLKKHRVKFKYWRRKNPILPNFPNVSNNFILVFLNSTFFFTLSFLQMSNILKGDPASRTFFFLAASYGSGYRDPCPGCKLPVDLYPVFRILIQLMFMDQRNHSKHFRRDPDPF